MVLMLGTRQYHVIDLMLDVRVGDEVVFTLLRDGNEITVSADLLTALHPSKDGSQSAVIIKLEY